MAAAAAAAYSRMIECQPASQQQSCVQLCVAATCSAQLSSAQLSADLPLVCLARLVSPDPRSPHTLVAHCIIHTSRSLIARYYCTSAEAVYWWSTSPAQLASASLITPLIFSFLLPLPTPFFVSITVR